MRQSFVVLEAPSHMPWGLVSGLADGRLRISAYRRPTAAHRHAAACRQRPLRLAAAASRGLGMLYTKTGQREQARSELTTAIAMYREMAMTFWLPQTEAALAQVQEG
jgi:hypothetical protein